MITTVDTKREQLRNGCFESGSGPEKILIIGSCRCMGYVNYLVRANADNSMTIRKIDPHDFHWNEQDEFIDFEAKINSLETDPRILQILRETTVYIHEYFDSFGMFNSSRDNLKNIYQFGLNPRLDICIPNYHDVPIIGFDRETGVAALEKFYGICRKTDFPEMEQYFRDNWKTTRMFWSWNHVSKNFTLFIFRLMNEKFLHLKLDSSFWAEAEKEDLFSNTPEKVEHQDRYNHGIVW